MKVWQTLKGWYVKWREAVAKVAAEREERRQRFGPLTQEEHRYLMSKAWCNVVSMYPSGYRATNNTLPFTYGEFTITSIDRGPWSWKVEVRNKHDLLLTFYSGSSGRGHPLSDSSGGPPEPGSIKWTIVAPGDHLPTKQSELLSEEGALSNPIGDVPGWLVRNRYKVLALFNAYKEMIDGQSRQAKKKAEAMKRARDQHEEEVKRRLRGE